MQQKGFTLLELILTMSLVVILIALAVPAFNSLLQNNRATAYANSFMNDLLLARNEAIKRGNNITLCPVTLPHGTVCSSNLADWQNGWIIKDTGIIYANTTPSNKAFFTQAASQSIVFNSGGFLENSASGNYDIQLTNCHGAYGAKRITISSTGRATLSSLNCN